MGVVPIKYLRVQNVVQNVLGVYSLEPGTVGTQNVGLLWYKS